MAGQILSEQPGDRKVIDCTHFNTWFEGSLDEGASEQDKLAAFDGASFEDKVRVLVNVLSSWEATAGRSLLDMDGFDGTLDLVRAAGWDNTIKLIVYGLLEAGFDVYVGDNFIEIYGYQPVGDMEMLRYNQRDMESAVEIAYIAGNCGFRTPNSRDMMFNFIDWAVALEKTPYKDDDWLELIGYFADEMLFIEVERGRASCDSGHRSTLPSIRNPKSYDEWKALNEAVWVYLPDLDDHILNKGEFVKLCEGNDQRAYELFCMCEWQHPATVIAESGGLEQLFEQEVVYGKLAQAAGKKLPLQVLLSGSVYCLGTRDEEGNTFSRESAAYYPTIEAANKALDSGDWTQREEA